MKMQAYNKLWLFVVRHYKTMLPYLTLRKIFNMLLALLEMQIGKIRCASLPFVFRIDPSSVCNLRCPVCNAHKIVSAKKRMMAISDYVAILDKIQEHAIRISLYDMGEPLLNKEIYSMIKYTSERRIGTSISTNFNLFNKSHLSALFDSRLTVLEPCLDGFTQESYTKYRIGGDVETVKNGIRLIMAEKKRINATRPVVDVQVILFDHISEELNRIHDFLVDCKVDKITYRKECGGFDSNKNVPGTTAAPIGRSCFWLYLGMAVEPNGDVHPCCGRGFDNFTYGNIREQKMADIWNNRYYRFSRGLFRKGPALKYDKEMQSIPCLTCKKFTTKRTMEING